MALENKNLGVVTSVITIANIYVIWIKLYHSGNNQNKIQL